MYSSLEALSLGFENRKLDVWGKEEKRREAFYKNRPLKDKKEVDEVVKYEIPTIQKKEHTEEERSGEEDTLEL